MKKVLFIGDSITQQGEHLNLIDAYFKLNPHCGTYVINNGGVSGETASGLTEPTFTYKRSNIADRIDRLLEYYNDDYAIIMYGVNDGIYSPFNEERFEKYKDGILNLVKKCKKAGLKTFLCTPTIFDHSSFSGKLFDNENAEAKSGECYIHYNKVMTKYAQWIKDEMPPYCDKIIDVNKGMNDFLVKMKKTVPIYISGDGVHPNIEFSALIAETILWEGFNIRVEMQSFIKNRSFMKMFAKASKRNQILFNYEMPMIKNPIAKLKQPPKVMENCIARLDKKMSRLAKTAISSGSLSWTRSHIKKFKVNNRDAVIIYPKKKITEGKWLWRTEFLGAYPEADKLALSRGYHIAYINILDGYGADDAISDMYAFYEKIVNKYYLNKKCVLLGLSRGGLSAVNFAVKYPDCVHSLILDAPVVDLRSWPKGEFGGKGSLVDSEKMAIAYGNDPTLSERYSSMLEQHIAKLEQSNIPIAMLTNTYDDIVPYSENGILIKAAYDIKKELFLEVLRPEKGHHPHGKESIQALNFIEKFKY